MLYKSLIISIFLAFIASYVQGFEDGAGGCTGGKVAVGGTSCIVVGMGQLCGMVHEQRIESLVGCFLNDARLQQENF